MNLQPFYELRERLHAAANAGVNLITEDFRLKRAAAAIEPFAKASPIFKKIDQMVKELTDASCTNRSMVLLDTLALLDAVLVTQGVNVAEGDLEPLGSHVEDEGFLKNYRNIPAGMFRPLREAMTGTGGGRYNVIVDTHKACPELFDDFRIRGLLVDCLGDSYAEIASQAASWLKEKGEEIVPVLKKGFDPEGKKEMVHRVNIIAGVSGAKENAFYLEQLPKSKKEVREALIEALHFEPQNAELLLNLIKTEKGRAKASAQWASGFMDSEEIRKYWKKTASAPKFLEDSDQQWASELLAENLLQLLDKWLEGSAADMDFEKLFAYSEALKGKMTEKYGRILDSLAALWEKMKDDPTVKKRKSGDNSRNALEAVEAAISDLMTEGLAKAAVCQPENVAVMAVEINKVFERYGESYLEEAFVASLFTEPAEVTFEKFSPYIKKREILPAKREQCKREAEQIMNTFISIEYSKERQAYLYGYSLGISWNGEYRGDDQAVLPHGLDLRWYPLIFQYEWKKDIAGHRYFGSDHYGGFDALVRSLFRVDTEELRTWYGDYYYQKVTNETPYIEWFDLLMECGWKNVTGILKQTILRNRSWTVYAVRMLPEKLGLTRTETIRELEAARAELQNEQKSRETVERLIEELKRGVAFGDLR